MSMTMAMSSSDLGGNEPQPEGPQYDRLKPVTLKNLRKKGISFATLAAYVRAYAAEKGFALDLALERAEDDTDATYIERLCSVDLRYKRQIKTWIAERGPVEDALLLIEDNQTIRQSLVGRFRDEDFLSVDQQRYIIEQGGQAAADIMRSPFIDPSLALNQQVIDYPSTLAGSSSDESLLLALWNKTTAKSAYLSSLSRNQHVARFSSDFVTAIFAGAGVRISHWEMAAQRIGSARINQVLAAARGRTLTSDEIAYAWIVLNEAGPRMRYLQPVDGMTKTGEQAATLIATILDRYRTGTLVEIPSYSTPLSVMDQENIAMAIAHLPEIAAEITRLRKSAANGYEANAQIRESSSLLTAVLATGQPSHIVEGALDLCGDGTAGMVRAALAWKARQD